MFEFNILTISEKDNSPLLADLRVMLEKQWGKFAPFEPENQGLKAPASLVVTHNKMVVGGLVFSLYKVPDSSKIGVWINGLIVNDNYRRQGIASSLIKRAVACAYHHNINVLHVSTDIPTLYSNHGWQRVAKNGTDSVLKISLKNFAVC